jgi:hypothetical protein
MAKTKTPAVSVISAMTAAVASTLYPVEYKSLRDFGYQSSGKTAAVRADGGWALDNIPNFPEEIDKERREELYEGYRQRYSEENPEVEYAVIDGNYLPVSQLSSDTKILERVNIGVIHAFSYSQQAFGALKETDPNKHSLIKDIRTKVNKYCYNCLDDLKTAARKVKKARNPESNARAATDAFNVAAAKALSKIKDRVKTAEARGDVTADQKALDQAIIAFKVKYESLTGYTISEN